MNVDLKNLEALAKAATAGVWERGDGNEVSVSDEGDESYWSWEQAGPAQLHGGGNQPAADADYIAAASPANILNLLSEMDALHDRAAYWRQRAKSAEGHLYAADFQAACDELHQVSNYAEIPHDQLTGLMKARISSAVNAVLRAVNAQRDRRRPTDVTDQRDNQKLTQQASNHSDN